MDGSASSLSYWRGKKILPSEETESSYPSPVPPTLEPLSKPDSREGSELVGELCQLALSPLAKDGVYPEPLRRCLHTQAPCSVCPALSSESKSSSVLPPLPALQPNGGCPSVTAAAHDEFRCSEGRLRTGVGWVKGGGGRGNPTSSTTLSTFQRRWGPEGATCLTADLRPSQVPAPLTQPPPWAQVVPELRQCVGPAGGSG